MAGRSPLLITICTTAATLIMYVSLGTILFLVAVNFGPKNKGGAAAAGIGPGAGAGAPDEEGWGPFGDSIANLMAGASNTSRWDHVEVWYVQKCCAGGLLHGVAWCASWVVAHWSVLTCELTLPLDVDALLRGRHKA